MKKSIWLAIIGVAALTGCRNEVMQERKYIPAPQEDAAAVNTADVPAAVNEAPEAGTVRQQPVQDAPTAQAAAQEFKPMPDFPGEKGITDDAAPRGKGRGKGRRSSGNGGAVANGGAAAGAAGEYVVQSGDTPEKIARKHRVRLSDLMKANNLTEDDAKRLRIGQKLVIPAPRPRGKGGFGGAPAAGPGEYVVQSGDTPEKIARRHHVRLSELMKANNLSEDDAKRLRIGQKLVIPGKGPAGKPAAKPAAKPAPGKPAAPAAAKPAPATPAAKPAAKPAPAKPAAPALRRIEGDDTDLVYVPYDMPVKKFAELVGISEAELRELNADLPASGMLQKEALYNVPKK